MTGKVQKDYEEAVNTQKILSGVMEVSHGMDKYIS